MIKHAKQKGSYDEMMARLDDVKDFWTEVHEKEVRPLLNGLDPDVRQEVLTRTYLFQVAETGQLATLDDADDKKVAADGIAPATGIPAPDGASGDELGGSAADEAGGARQGDADDAVEKEATEPAEEELSPADVAVREIKTIYITAKRRYRIGPARVQKLQAALDRYVGTHNFHNFTVRKSFHDASSKRHIKSFEVNPTPIRIRDTEWLSIKVHGQSFMMHQIRKMVAMAVMLVRCGSALDTIDQSYQNKRISIPKAPGLGLLLERPVFENYDLKARDSYGRDPIDFTKYDKEIREFKDQEIYRRMWDVEEQKNAWVTYFFCVESLFATTAGRRQAG